MQFSCTRRWAAATPIQLSSFIDARELEQVKRCRWLSPRHLIGAGGCGKIAGHEAAAALGPDILTASGGLGASRNQTSRQCRPGLDLANSQTAAAGSAHGLSSVQNLLLLDSCST
jgi:hypothetical protein